MCGMLLLNPVRGILSVATSNFLLSNIYIYRRKMKNKSNKKLAFEKLEDANVNLWLQKLAFVGAQLLCLGIGVYSDNLPPFFSFLFSKTQHLEFY